MEYKDIRKKFAELSGRYDLIKADYQDDGADFFLNAGQRMLDRKSSFRKGSGKSVQTLAAGTIIVKSVGLRFVDEVWITDSDGGRTELEKCTLADLRAYYGEILSSVDADTPEYYAPANLRPYPDTSTFTGLSDIEDLLVADNHYTYNGIIVMPPPDAAYTISIVGKFFSPTLSATLSGSTWTQTKSYWTEEEPMMLISAALYQLERVYRNTEGMKDHMVPLSDDLGEMDKDVAEEDATGVDQIEG
jgi:hypothetical protein